MMTEVTKLNSGGEAERRFSASRLVMVDNFIFTMNSAGVNPKTGQYSPDPVEQTKQVISNFEHSLAQVGSNLADVIRMTVHIPDPADIITIMEVVGAAFKGIDPARTVVCTPLGMKEMKLEMELMAYKGAGGAKQHRINSELFGAGTVREPD
jgi:enamine deaminase RidA (YjgF/YER057c/UK114 family)